MNPIVLVGLYALVVLTLAVLIHRWNTLGSRDRSVRLVFPVNNDPEMEPIPEPDNSLTGFVERTVLGLRQPASARAIYRSLRRSGYTQPCRVPNVQAVLERLVTNHHTVIRKRPTCGSSRARRLGTRYAAA